MNAYPSAMHVLQQPAGIMISDVQEVEGVRNDSFLRLNTPIMVGR